jgi:heme-degrading monooxygenase HmoA
MFIVTNTMHVPAEDIPHIAQAFRGSDERMQQVPGCLDFKLMLEEKSEGEPVFVAMTTWEDEQSFQTWMQSDEFQQAHTNAAGSSIIGEMHSYAVVVGG